MMVYKLISYTVNYIEYNYKLGHISDDAYKYYYRRLYLLAGQNLEIALINVDMANLDKELIN